MDDADKRKDFEFNKEYALRAHDLNRQTSAELRKSAIDSANIAIKSLLLINGGAVIALLAFVGSIEASDAGANISAEPFVASIWWFAFGVGLSAAVAFLAYMIMLFDQGILDNVDLVWDHPYVKDKPIVNRLWWIRTVLHILAMLLAVGTLCAFFYGVYSVTEAVKILAL